MPDISIGTLDPPPRRGFGTGAGRGGLPRPLTSFIGRERELAQARRLLEDSYLVTLTGPAGSGKTRLCIALAAAVAAEYPDGVFFVSLAPVRDPELVASTIAQTLGLQDARDRTRVLPAGRATDDLLPHARTAVAADPAVATDDRPTPTVAAASSSPATRCAFTPRRAGRA